MTKRWADNVDEEAEVFVTVRLPSGKSTHVVMESLERGALLEEAASHVDSWFFVRVAVDFAN